MDNYLDQQDRQALAHYQAMNRPLQITMLDEPAEMPTQEETLSQLASFEGWAWRVFWMLVGALIGAGLSNWRTVQMLWGVS
jgi:hypothetical protein